MRSVAANVENHVVLKKQLFSCKYSTNLLGLMHISASYLIYFETTVYSKLAATDLLSSKMRWEVCVPRRPRRIVVCNVHSAWCVEDLWTGGLKIGRLSFIPLFPDCRFVSQTTGKILQKGCQKKILKKKGVKIWKDLCHVICHTPSPILLNKAQRHLHRNHPPRRIICNDYTAYSRG
jgi:hypothetical protein